LLSAAAFLLVPRVASATPLSIAATMNGAQEVPMHTTGATGACTAVVDPATGNVTLNGTFTGLSAPATAASLHGLAGLGVTAPVLLNSTFVSSALSGTFSGSGSLSPTQIAGMLAGDTYCEIADNTFPSGEIRGQLAAATPAIPAPAVLLLLLAVGSAGIAAMRMRPRNMQPSR
jgi:hypothetical protein